MLSKFAFEVVTLLGSAASFSYHPADYHAFKKYDPFGNIYYERLRHWPEKSYCPALGEPGARKSFSQTATAIHNIYKCSGDITPLGERCDGIVLYDGTNTDGSQAWFFKLLRDPSDGRDDDLYLFGGLYSLKVSSVNLCLEKTLKQQDHDVNQDLWCYDCGNEADKPSCPADWREDK